MTFFACLLSESEESGNSDCVNRPVEGELESVIFRVKGKFLLLEEEVAGTLKNSQEETQPKFL